MGIDVEAGQRVVYGCRRGVTGTLRPRCMGKGSWENRSRICWLGESEVIGAFGEGLNGGDDGSAL